MNYKFKILILAIVTAMLLLVVVSASASTPIHGEGKFELVGQKIIDQRKVGSNLIVDQILVFDNSGALDGLSTAEVTCIVSSAGDSTCHGREWFKGSLENKIYGMLLFNVVVRIDKSGALEGQWTVIKGAGGLSNLHGTGKLAGNAVSGTYTLEYTLVP